MDHGFDINEASPNVKMVRDGHGELWLCDAEVGTRTNLAGQGCVRAESVIYDRMFGG
jgi:hypothetical protein